MTSSGPQAYAPITADDDELREALEAANVPSLMCALVHITGDMSHVRGPIQPTSTLFADPQGGISDEAQATVRELAFELLRTFRDAGSALPGLALHGRGARDVELPDRGDGAARLRGVPALRTGDAGPGLPRTPLVRRH